MLVRLSAFALLVGVSFAACSSDPSGGNAAGNDAGASVAEEEDAGESADPDAGALAEGENPLPGCPRDPGPGTVTVDPAAKSDPVGGAAKFTLADALAGYPESSGILTALITTEKSTIRCELAEDVAPISVANFVGLARGTRPFKKSGKWRVGRFYDGLLWHRVIPDFMIQGGDPLGRGTGGPGYDLVEENHVDEPQGTLAMAASATPSGSQFFVVVGKGPAPDYNVFGTCSTEAAIAISEVPRDANDKPNEDVHMTRIDIARCPK